MGNNNTKKMFLNLIESSFRLLENARDAALKEAATTDTNDNENEKIPELEVGYSYFGQ